MVMLIKHLQVLTMQTMNFEQMLRDNFYRDLEGEGEVEGVGVDGDYFETQFNHQARRPWAQSSLKGHRLRPPLPLLAPLLPQLQTPRMIGVPWPPACVPERPLPQPKRPPRPTPTRSSRSNPTPTQR